MDKPKVLRKRYMPDELVDISGDELLYRDKHVLITRWKTIKPRTDIEWGVSFTFLTEGYKISRFYDKNNTFLYWYCDIIEAEYYEATHTYLVKDLLVDVKIMPDGKVKLLDAEDLSIAFTKNILSKEQIVKALHHLGKLYDLINPGHFPPPICNDQKFYVPPAKQLTTHSDTETRTPIVSEPHFFSHHQSNFSKNVRVMVVDDSVFFNKILSDELASNEGIEIVASAFDAYEAERKVEMYRPDVITLDIEMPGLNGIEFLKRLMIKRPMPVIIVSSASQYVFEAFNAGAIEFVDKPQSMVKGDLENFAKDLTAKIKVAAKAKVGLEGLDMKKNFFDVDLKFTKETIIAIGASTGGTDATYKILTALPANMPPIIISQHMPLSFTKMYADRLNRFSRLEVMEAADGMVASPGRVLIAPGDFHMRLRKQGNHYAVMCSKEEKVNGHRPSVDVMFESVAEIAGRHAYGIILTGMGGDGAKGLLKMRNMGAQTIGQDEATCVVYGMPRVAFDIGAVEKQVPIEKVVPTLIEFMQAKHDQT